MEMERKMDETGGDGKEICGNECRLMQFLSHESLCIRHTSILVDHTRPSPCTGSPLLTTQLVGLGFMALSTQIRLTVTRKSKRAV